MFTTVAPTGAAFRSRFVNARIDRFAAVQRPAIAERKRRRDAPTARGEEINRRVGHAGLRRRAARLCRPGPGARAALLRRVHLGRRLGRRVRRAAPPRWRVARRSRSAPTARARMRRRTTPARSPSSTRGGRPAGVRRMHLRLRLRRCLCRCSGHAAVRRRIGGRQPGRPLVVRRGYASHAIVSFDRAADGQLTYAGCLRTSRPAACAPTPPGPWAGSTTSR